MSEPKTAQKRNVRLLLMGVLLLSIGLGWTGLQLHGLLTWERTTAKVLKVVTIDSESGSNRSRTYQPTLEITDRNGKTHVMTPGYTSAQFNFERGDQVPVIYKPNDLTSFRITTFTSYWIWPLTALALGALIVVLTVRSQSDEETPEAGTDTP